MVRKKPMKRLCVFYRLADRFLGNKKIEWIVCKRMSASFDTRREAENRLAESSQTERNGRQSKTL